MFGVDEAGKGPVLGSMVAAAVAVPDEGLLPEGVADSKTLTPERRETVAEAIRADDRLGVATAAVPVERIDDPETDMNSLTVEAQARALSAVASDGDEGVVDAGDVDADRFGARVECSADPAVAVRAKHGADSTHRVVAAASVVAKVARDAHVADLADRYGEVGSGYPSDPTTRAFLREWVREHGDLPPCARESWATCEDLLAAAEQSSLDVF